MSFVLLLPDTRPVWYRIQDGRYAPALDEWDRPVGEGRTYLSILEFPVIRETAQGVWLETHLGPRFVLKNVRKRFACPTVEEAEKSFRARKQQQIRILTSRLQQAQEALNLPVPK